MAKLVIQQSPWGWSLYVNQDDRLTREEALVCSANDPYQLVQYAIEDLDSSVLVLRSPELFLFLD